MRTLYYLFLFMFLQGAASAAPSKPSVSGTFSHGQSITVIGSAFGAKSTAAPLLWDSVDNQGSYSALNNGDPVPYGPGYPWEYTRALAINTSEGKAGSRCYKSTGNQYISHVEGRTLGTSPAHIYISWWWMPSAEPTTNLTNHSSKFLRLSRGANLVNQTFSWTQIQHYIYDAPTTAPNFWDTYPSSRANTWNFHEMWVNNLTKTYTLRVNNQNIRSNASWSTSSFNFDYLWKLGWDGGGTSPVSMTTWTDDIYVDNSFARLFVCDSSTYSGSNHCEMLIPTAWGASSITATVNTGTFASGSTVYLYVVDEDGGVSPSSDAITVGESLQQVCDPSHLGFCTDQSSCSTAGGFWYNNVCNFSQSTTCYQDADNDLYGNGVVEYVSTQCSSGYYLLNHFTSTSGDCNDADPTVNPGATDTCGVADKNCDYSVDSCPSNRLRWGTGTAGWGTGTTGQ